MLTRAREPTASLPRRNRRLLEDQSSGVHAGPSYLSLAQRLGPDQPFLGLLHPDSVATSIKAMAEFSVKSIRAVQLDGPYFVAGWCSAGLIACEIAQRLLIQGQEVALLTLFDAVNPGRLDELSVPQVLFVLADETFRKIWFHLRSMSRLGFRDLPAYARERLKNVWHTLTRRTWPARVGMELLHQVSREPANMYLLGRRYRPTPYNGRVLLFRRSLRPISRYLDWRLGWWPRHNP
jgi:thioesterase domain-containing protein